MKTKNKILSVIIAILMIISIIPITTSAAKPTSGTCGENVTWEFDKSTGTLYFFGTGAMNNIYDSYRYIPWIDYFFDIENVVISEGIYTIVNYAFYNCDNLVNITLPNTLTSIGHNTFEECDGLTNITIPDSVIEIGGYAFSCCRSLTSVTIPNSVTEIGEEAFSQCTSLTSITLSNNVTAINFFAFLNCTNLTSVTIPESVTTIRVSAFENCESITDVYYSGTEKQWKQISIDLYNRDLTGANIHYNSTGADTHPYNPVITAPTCIEQGYTTYTCACGYSYVGDYVEATHSYKSEITTPATHTTTGVMTYTCACGDTYTETIDKLEEHKHNAVITAPTCTEQGHTTYTCECGDSYIADYIDATGHTEKIIPAIAPTCTETGLTEGAKCSVCGETLTKQKELPANGHNYNDVVTVPTCTEQGYTTYICECGDTYVDDYVDATGHTHSTAVEENYIAPTCTSNGSADKVVYCSVCNEELSRTTETIEMLGHSDNDGDGYCDSDNELLDPSVECDHSCHKEGISGFFWRIINVFNMLFGLNKTCDCGIAHY